MKNIPAAQDPFAGTGLQPEHVDKLKALFPTPEDQAALRSCRDAIQAAVQANNDIAKQWESLSTAKTVVVGVLRTLLKG